MSTARPLTLAGLDQAVEALLLGSPLSRGRRLLGVEYERLVLRRETDESAPLDFCRQLFTELMDDLHATPVWDGEVLGKMLGGDFGMSMEPGGQIEIATPPRPSLADLDRIVHRVTQAIDRRLEPTDYRLVCLGHAPVTPVAEIGLLPRKRYLLMDETMVERGALSRNMMRATAGFQAAYDITGREDAARKLALLNRLSPVLLAMTANSPMAEGRDTGYRSFRHAVWWDTDHLRSRLPEGGLRAETAIEGYVRYARKAVVLFTMREGKLTASTSLTLEQLVERGEIDLEDLDLHLSSLFPMVRLRNYLEVRCFDSVPWPLARSIIAMLSGILYCGNAMQHAEELSERLVVGEGEPLRELHLQAARRALDARAPDGTSFRDIATELTELAAGRLGDRDCSWAHVDDLVEAKKVVQGQRVPGP